MQRSKLLLINSIVIVFVLLWILPFFFTFTNAVKSSEGFFSGSFWGLPDQFNLLKNIQLAWVEGGLGSGFVNSLVYGILGALFGILIAALAAFSLTTLKVKGRFFWFLLIYSGTVFPFQMYLIPIFRLYTDFNLYDTRLGLCVFYTAVSVPFCLFVLRNYFTTISKEMIEAARIDGSSDFRIFAQMVLPMSKAPIMVLFLFQFTFIWNDLLFGLTLSRSEEVRPVMAGIASMQGLYSGGNTPILLAGALIVSIPTLFLFIFLQKHFIRGLTLTGK